MQSIPAAFTAHTPDYHYFGVLWYIERIKGEIKEAPGVKCKVSGGRVWGMRATSSRLPRRSSAGLKSLCENSCLVLARLDPRFRGGDSTGFRGCIPTCHSRESGNPRVFTQTLKPGATREIRTEPVSGKGAASSHRPRPSGVEEGYACGAFRSLEIKQAGD
jgi:hypothetical protein